MEEKVNVDGIVITEYIGENGKAISYTKDGKLHREDGPAYIKYDENGIIKDERYYLNNELFRHDNGPTWISYEEDAVYECYYEKDVLNLRHVNRIIRAICKCRLQEC
jgi:hypothetical protein